MTFVLAPVGMAGGVRVIAIYADRLFRLGHEVTLVSVPQPRLGLGKKLKFLVRRGRWPKDPELEPSYLDNISTARHRIIDSARPIIDDDLPDADIVVATYWRTAPWVAALSPVKGAKAILVQGYEIPPGKQDPELDAAWHLPLHKIVISNWLAELARDRFGDSDVHLVPNSVELTQFYAFRRNKHARPTVGLLYHSSELKGVDVSLAALNIARDKLPDLRVLAFGAEHISAALPLPKWVEFFYRPAQDELRQIYSQCDVWLCGSRREGFHLPPLEAMACRCPVVSTRVGGPMDIIEEGINGYLVAVEDWPLLADRLVHVLQLKDEDWTRMSDAALATATRYTWDDATHLLERAFLDVLASEATFREPDSKDGRF